MRSHYQNEATFTLGHQPLFTIQNIQIQTTLFKTFCGCRATESVGRNYRIEQYGP